MRQKHGGKILMKKF